MSSKPATYEPYRPAPLYIAIVAHLKSREQAALDYRRQYQDAYAAFLDTQKAIGVEALKTVQDAHAALAETGTDDPEAYQATYQTALQVQQDYHSGVAVRDAIESGAAIFRKAVAAAEEVAGHRIAAGERAYVRLVQQEIAGIDPDALDPEMLSLVRQALQTAMPTAGLAEVEANEPPPVVKGGKAKASADDRT